MYKKIFTAIAVLGILILGFFGYQWFFARQSSLSHYPTWHIKVDLQRQRADNEYDVIVIGSGFGGLSSGALLAKQGYKVLILEQASYLGGYGATWQENGFSFSWGAEDIGGLWERGCMTYLIKQLGLDQQKLFKPVTRRIIAHGKTVDIAAGPDQLQKSLINLFPHQKEALDRFFNDARTVYYEAYDAETAGRFGLPALGKVFLDHMLTPQEMSNYLKTHAHMMQWRKSTYQQKLDEYFKDEDIKTIFKALLSYIGAKSSSNAFHVVTALFDYFFFGSGYPQGGPGNLAIALANYIKQHNGTVLLNSRVTQVLVSEKSVSGVMVGSQQFKAPLIIANLNAKTLYTQLINPEHLDKKFLSELNSLELGSSTFGVYLGLDMDLSQYPVFIRDMDNRIHLLLSSNGDSSLAPKGQSSIAFFVPASYDSYPKPGSSDYEHYTQKIAQEAIERAEKVIPGLSAHIKVKRFMTPYDFEKAVLMPKGAIYGFASSSGRPCFKSPIKGLYLASATSGGGGVVGVVFAGLATYHDIMGWQKN